MAQSDSYYQAMSADALAAYAANGAAASAGYASKASNANTRSLWNAAVAAYQAAIYSPTWQHVKAADQAADKAADADVAPGPPATAASKPITKRASADLEQLGIPSPGWSLKKKIVVGGLVVVGAASGGYAIKRFVIPHVLSHVPFVGRFFARHA